MEYERYGKEWKKETMELPIVLLEQLSGLEKRKGEKKVAFLDRVTINLKEKYDVKQKV